MKLGLAQQEKYYENKFKKRISYDRQHNSEKPIQIKIILPKSIIWVNALKTTLFFCTAIFFPNVLLLRDQKFPRNMSKVIQSIVTDLKKFAVQIIFKYPTFLCLCSSNKIIFTTPFSFLLVYFIITDISLYFYNAKLTHSFRRRCI